MFHFSTNKYEFKQKTKIKPPPKIIEFNYQQDKKQGDNQNFSITINSFSDFVKNAKFNI